MPDKLPVIGRVPVDPDTPGQQAVKEFGHQVDGWSEASAQVQVPLGRTEMKPERVAAWIRIFCEQHGRYSVPPLVRDSVDATIQKLRKANIQDLPAWIR